MKKELGQVFTPQHIVCFILDEAEYKDKKVLTSRILEPSFGEGVFLLEIINRIINAAKKENLQKEEIENIIKNNVYGFEIDTVVYNKAIENINSLLVKNKLTPNILKNNLLNIDSLKAFNQFFNFFDLIIGNPPYVRVKNLPDATRQQLKSFKFTNGTTDLYIAFFEIAFHMLNSTGKIGFITPNSFLYNTSQQNFRKFLFENKYIEKIYNYEDSQIFDNVSTRTCVSILSKTKKSNFSYVSLAIGDDKFQTNIDYDNINYKHPYYLSDDDFLFINKNQNLPLRLGDFIDIQNGISTNADSVYIFNDDTNIDLEKDLLKSCIKSSRCDSPAGKKKILFPYKASGIDYVPISENELKSYPKCYQYLLSKKLFLTNRDIDKNTSWFLFARQQGLKKMHQEKLAIKHIFSHADTKIQTILLSPSEIVYSKYFITSKKTDNNKDFLLTIQKILESEEFLKYIKILSHKKRGGYLELTAEMIKNFGIKHMSFCD